MEHTTPDDLPTAIVTPKRKGSVLEPLIETNKVFVSWTLSSAMSPMQRCHVGSNDDADGQQISPDRRNPKKRRFIAAQIIIESWSVGYRRRMPSKACRMSGVIGRRWWEGVDLEVDHFMPFSNSWSQGRCCSEKGE